MLVTVGTCLIPLEWCICCRRSSENADMILIYMYMFMYTCANIHKYTKMCTHMYLCIQIYKSINGSLVFGMW